jgi:N-acetylmuramoyl-L-alanine amidase
MKKVALVIGHSERSQGASNHNGMTEYKFNERLALLIAGKMCEYTELQPLIIYRNCSYYEFPAKINSLNPDAVVSLHANAHDKNTSGNETLIHHNSQIAFRLAYSINRKIYSVLRMRNRGIKHIHKGERGYHILSETKAPCCILESFFIDSDNDLKNALNNFEDLADAIILGCIEFFSGKTS